MKIIYRTGNGGVAVVDPAGQRDGEDVTAWLDRVRAVAVPEGAPSAIVEDTVIPARDRRSSWRWADGKVTIDGAAALAEAKAAALRAIDDTAEKVRLRYISPGDGMAMTYREKFEQAQAVHSLGEAAANALSQASREAQFPTLSASVGIEAATLWDCAALVLQRYAAFAQLSLGIERARLSAKKAVQSAPDIASARAAHGATVWPT